MVSDYGSINESQFLVHVAHESLKVANEFVEFEKIRDTQQDFVQMSQIASAYEVPMYSPLTIHTLVWHAIARILENPRILETP